MRINIVFFLILITCLNVFSKSTTAQISLHIEKGDLETVFKAIEKQTDYSFMYEVSLLKGSGVVSIDVRDAGLKEVLDEVFRGQPIAYEIVAKTITLKAREREGVMQQESRDITIKGRVTDKQGNSLVGVSVRIKGTKMGTLTDQNGNYSIASDPDGVIIFSYIGYKTFNIMINGQTEINMIMVGVEAQLKETVIKGYYNATKKLNTGNVTTVTAKQIERQPISDPIASLQGLVPGLFVQQTSGVPGRKLNVRIRGANSLANGNDPLYIIDGVQYNSSELNTSNSQFSAGGFASPFNYLSSTDIESITVLKDADATAIYGSRGANGVILIISKKGATSKPKFDVSLYTGYAKANQRVHFMNTSEYLSMRKEAFANDNATPQFYDYDLNGTWDSTKDTNWQNYLIGGNASITQVNVAYSATTGNIGFRISGTYRKEGTIFPGDFNNKKGGLSLGISNSSLNGKLDIHFTSSYNSSENFLPPSGIESRITLAPNAPQLYNEDGTLNWANSTFENPMSLFQLSVDENAKNLIGNLVIKYKLLKGLELKTSLGYNYTDFKQINITPSSAYDPKIPIPTSFLRQHQRMTNNISTWVAEPQIAYSKVYDNQSEIDILLGTTFQSTGRDYNAITGIGYISDELLKTLSSATSFFNIISLPSEYRYNAIYARLGYSIMNKYVVNLTGRRDGSSRFGPGKRFGNFGALGLAWIFSEEKFIKTKYSFITYGKLRLSYGITGNDQIGEYKYLDTYAPSQISYQNVSSMIPKQITNPKYGWEQVGKAELGLEVGLLNDKIMINSSFYRNRTSNQLVDYPISVVAGFPTVKANIPAIIQNTGFEFDISSRVLVLNRFQWTTSLNFTIPHNKLISFENIEASSYARRFVVGQPTNSLTSLYSYLENDPATGLYVFEDVNIDGQLTTSQDQRHHFVGQNFYGGITNHLIYNKFNLDFSFNYIRQNGIAYNINGIPGIFNGGYGNQLSSKKNEVHFQMFTQSNPSAFTTSDNFNQSDALLKDASYLRLQNVSLSYNFSFNKSKLSGSIFALGQNLFTWSKYTGFDPETPTNSVNIPILKTITLGIKCSL